MHEKFITNGTSEIFSSQVAGESVETDVRSDIKL